MSDFTDNMKPLLGVLNQNVKKATKKQPDYTGFIKLEDGKVMKLAGWKKINRANKPYLSLKLSENKPYVPADKPQEDGTPF